jgi:hypothetical protein
VLLQALNGTPSSNSPDVFLALLAGFDRFHPTRLNDNRDLVDTAGLIVHDVSGNRQCCFLFRFRPLK